TSPDCCDHRRKHSHTGAPRVTDTDQAALGPQEGSDGTRDRRTDAVQRVLDGLRSTAVHQGSRCFDTISAESCGDGGIGIEVVVVLELLIDQMTVPTIPLR